MRQPDRYSLAFTRNRAADDWQLRSSSAGDVTLFDQGRNKALVGVVAWITRRLILSGGFQSQVFSLLMWISTMPHKFNADRRDKIAKQKYQVTNWPAFNESLGRSDDLTSWD
ncbi:hypothetical protein [Rhizobium ruizarguesonis]